MQTIVLLLVLWNSPLIQRGDDLFVKQAYQSAISLYQEHLKSNHEDTEALWRISRAYISYGDIVSRDEREQYFRLAETFATRAVKSDSLNSDAHTWRAVSLGYIALFEGSRTKVKLCNEIKRELDLAIQLNPNNDVAYSIYGSFYRVLGKVSWFERILANTLLGGLPDGGFPEAEQSLKKSIELAPTIIRHRFELGMVYRDMKRMEDAKMVFQEALKLPVLLASDKQRIERMQHWMTE